MITDLHPPISAVREVVHRALAEDLEPLGDMSGALVGLDMLASGRVVARQEGTMAGRLSFLETFKELDTEVEVKFDHDDGAEIQPGDQVAVVRGPLPAILAGERTALNLLCHLSGVATYTRRFVRASKGQVRILDTRKTTPGMRALEKAAVRAGGGYNHRGSLGDGIMLKDNHLAVMGIAEGVRRARVRWPGRAVHVECETLDQVREALEVGVERIMLDNMDPASIVEAVAVIDGAAETEVTGGVTLRNVGEFAATGVDFISIGALTHSAPILDFGLDLDQSDT